jgi:hypothetical protein
MPVTIKANAKPWNNCGGSPKIAAEKIAVNNGMKFAKKAATVGPAPFTPNPNNGKKSMKDQWPQIELKKQSRS